MIVDFIAYFLSLAMFVHLLIVTGVIIFHIAGISNYVLLTSWIEIGAAVFWIGLQLVVAFRHKHLNYLGNFILYLIFTPIFNVYLGLFCFQRLDDFDWGTR